MDPGHPHFSPFTQSPRGNSSSNQVPPHFQARLAALKSLAQNTGKFASNYNIHGLSQYYSAFLTFLAEIALEVEQKWPSETTDCCQTVPQTASPLRAVAPSIPFLPGIFHRLQELGWQLKNWCEDAFAKEIGEGNWDMSSDFRQSTLCRLVLRCLKGVRARLSEVVVHFLSIVLMCKTSWCVFLTCMP
jgi:hypothetical protein